LRREPRATQQTNFRLPPVAAQTSSGAAHVLILVRNAVGIDTDAGRRKLSARLLHEAARRLEPAHQCPVVGASLGNTRRLSI
jgi:hypothetical protein